MVPSSFHIRAAGAAFPNEVVVPDAMGYSLKYAGLLFMLLRDLELLGIQRSADLLPSPSHPETAPTGGERTMTNDRESLGFRLIILQPWAGGYKTGVRHPLTE